MSSVIFSVYIFIFVFLYGHKFTDFVIYHFYRDETIQCSCSAFEIIMCKKEVTVRYKECACIVQTTQQSG